MSRAMLVSLGLLLCAGAGVAAADNITPDDEGYIRHWLILAPIPLEAGQSGADGNGKDWIKDEARLMPKEGDKVTAGGKELAWKRYAAKESFADFNDYLGGQVENSVGLLVCYLNVPEEMTGLKLKMGSDDQAKVYLNGKEVLKNDTPRPLTKDEDTAENVTLRKGLNVLVFKVVNEGIDWSGSIRFVDKDDAAVKRFRVVLRPE